MSPKRAPLAKFGRYGAVVNVYGITLEGESVTRAEWREFGQRKTETFRGPKRDREAAAKAFAEGTADRLRHEDTPKPVRRTIGELWKAYLTAHSPDWRPKTRLLHLQRWKVFTNHVNPLTFADVLVAETLDSWREVLLGEKRKRTGKPMARNQVAHHIQLVKSVYRFAKSRKLIADNPIADYAVRKGRDYQALEVPEFTPDQWARIIAQFSPRDSRTWRPWAAICLDGLLAPRSNALLNIRWSDIRGLFGDGAGTVARTITWRGETDKLGKTRVQPLPRDAVYVLRVCRVWARRQGYTGDYVFYGVQQRTRASHWTYSALNARLNTACEQANVPRVKYQNMHALRRMRAGSVLEATGDITKAGDWLGDSDVRVMRKSYLRQRHGHLNTVVAGIALPARGKDDA